MAPKRRALSQNPSQSTSVSEGESAPVTAFTDIVLTVQWDELEYQKLADARPSSKDKKYYVRVKHFTKPKDNDRGTNKFVSVIVFDSSGELSITLYTELFGRYLAILSQYDALLRITDLDIMRATNGSKWWGRVGKKTRIERIPENMTWTDEHEEPPAPVYQCCFCGCLDLTGVATKKNTQSYINWRLI